MRALTLPRAGFVGSLCLVAMAVTLTGCASGSSDSVAVDGDVAIAYVKRPVGSLGNPTDAIMFTAGGDLYVRDQSAAGSAETNVTGPMTQGRGDVSDPEVSYDGGKLLFAMRCTTGSSPACLNPDGTGNDSSWRIWEYDIGRKTFARLRCTAASGTTPPGDDVDPAYLPDGRIVFVSNRQVTSQQVNGFAYLDEYERERVTTLHVMNGDGSNCRQISYNQSHDRNPTVLQTGEIMYSRWDHVGMRNQFSIFFTNPDGTNLFVLYGAHSPGNSYLHPREMPNGEVLSSLMPLSRTHEGGALMRIDIKNYSENCEPAPGMASGCSGQHQPTAHQINFGRGNSQYGRFSTPYPLWDGTSRALVAWAPSCTVTNSCINETNPLTGVTAPSEERTPPVYGIFMLDLNTGNHRPVVTAPPGYSVLDPVAIQARPLPNVISDKSLDTTLAGRTSTEAPHGLGILNVKSVYDTDSQGRMGNAVLVAGIGETIPRLNGAADIARLKDPARTTADKRPARFIRITRAVPTQSGISREAIGETDFEMQQILGYTEVEPDGSFKIAVPADVPLAITAIDKDGRAFTPHTNWIQVRPGETRTCNGCHSPRRGNAINGTGIAGNHPNTLLVAQSGESMAETRKRIELLTDAAALQLKPHMVFRDVWTDLSAPEVVAAGRTAIDPDLTIDYSLLATTPPATTGVNRGVIDYETHIAPLWTRNRGANVTCTDCHNNNNRADTRSVGLDLRDTTSGTGRLVSYDELLIGDPVLDANNQPILEVVEDEFRIRRDEPQVNTGASRESHLIEVLFNQELRSRRTLGATNHGAMLNASEKRLVAEWIDVGAQYYNSPRDSSGTLRGVTGLSETVFNTTVHPVLLARCGSCHQAVGLPGTGATSPSTTFTGLRFVLTGQAEGDFNVTLSMVGNTANPAQSELLRRPASNGVAPNPAHPQMPIGSPGALPVLSTSDPDYRAICNWIQAGACP